MKNKRKLIIIISIICVLLIGGIVTTIIIINNQNKPDSNNNNENNITETNTNTVSNLELNLKDSNIVADDKYTVDTFVNKDELPEGMNVRFESEEMTNYKEPGDYVIKLIFTDKDGNEFTKEVSLVITEKEENKEETKENTKDKKEDNNSKQTNNKKSSSNQPATNNSCNQTKYSDNVIVQRALSQVGQSGKLCTQLVDYAIKGVGKTLWIKNTYEVVSYCSNFRGMGCVDESKINDQYTFVNELDAQGLEILGYSKIRYYAVNNKIYKEEHFINGEWVDATDLPPVSTSGGKTLFEKHTSTSGEESLNTENIFKIATQVSLDNIQPGDILHYSNNGNGGKHVAVYIGNKQAVHGGWGSKKEVKIAEAFPSYASTPTAWRV